MTNDPSKPSWRQRLHFLTGDRKKEVAALTDSVVAAVGENGDTVGATDVPKAEIAIAAQTAVAQAHGDQGVEANDAVVPDLASPAAVADVLSGVDPPPPTSVRAQ